MIYTGLEKSSPLFNRLILSCLSAEIDKLIELFYLLRPDGTAADAYYWSHLPDTQGLHYYKSYHVIGMKYGPDLMAELPNTVMKTTAKTMILLVNLPVPAMLD